MGRGACLFALGLLLAGCVNDNGNTGPAQGDLGGPCFKNNTCNGSLVCVLVSGSALCQEPDGGSDATVDQSASDGSTSDAADAACNPPSKLACNQPCTGSSPYCCPEVQMCVQTAADCTSGKAWACQRSSDCTTSGAQHCCLPVTIDMGTCPASAQEQAGATCAAACSAGSFEPCTADADCAGQKCVPITIPNVTNTLGVCM